MHLPRLNSPSARLPRLLLLLVLMMLRESFFNTSCIVDIMKWPPAATRHQPAFSHNIPLRAFVSLIGIPLPRVLQFYNAYKRSKFSPVARSTYFGSNRIRTLYLGRSSCMKNYFVIKIFLQL